MRPCHTISISREVKAVLQVKVSECLMISGTDFLFFLYQVKGAQSRKVTLPFNYELFDPC